ncbi:MAG: PD40 domain-containing protein [Nocardioidaceae bacterium]|nr:PD40 domain-containing protein [Nocardioidaceae bacterium]
MTTHVVGFALTPQQTDLVRCVAEEGGGQLFGAANAQQLSGALTSAIAAAGVTGTPGPLPPVTAPAPLADVRTLAYHQITSWSAAANERGEEAPILSDDGQRLTFARAPGTGDAANPNRIFVANADGSGETEVDAYTPLCGCGSTIDLSGNGLRVVSSDRVQLRVAEASGGGGRELLALDSGEINAVRISGDGSTVVFRIYRDTTIRGTSPSQPIQRGIYAINPDGSGLRQLAGPNNIAPVLGVTPDQAGFFGGSSGLDVSANGARIVFTMFVPAVAGGGSGEGLFAVNSDGSGARKLLEASNVTAAAISGDGTRVAHVTYTAATGLQEAVVAGFDGDGQRTLTDSNTPHPGTGGNLPSGERIQLSMDGSRLLLGSTGLLYDTASGQALALGVGAPGGPTDPAALVIDGLYRATMDAGATRALYLFQPYDQPYQLVQVDLNPADLGGAPAIDDPNVSPQYVLTEGGSTATVSARVTPPSGSLWVSSRVLRDGLPDANTYTGQLADDGATSGDATAQDGLFTSNGIYTDCCAEVGPRTLRIKAENRASDGLQHATAVDVAPFQVSTTPIEGGPTPTTPSPATPPIPTVPPPTTVPGMDLAAQATIAAQAALIATLEAQPAVTASAGLTPTLIVPSPTLPPVPPTVPPLLTPLPVTPPTGPGLTQATPTPDAFITPDPAECTITPRAAEALSSLTASPDPAVIGAFAVASAAPGLDIPAGIPADEAIMRVIEDTYRLMTACFNAGNDLAAYALWTDDGLRQFQVSPPAGAQAPRPEGERFGFRVTEVRTLPDGRVAAVWDQLAFRSSATFVQLLVQQDNRYMIDETIDLAIPAVSDPGPASPTAGSGASG